MTRAGTALKPMVSMSMHYSQSVLDIAPVQISDATAQLVGRFAATIKNEGRKVKWDTLKVETKFSNARALWVTTISMEEDK